MKKILVRQQDSTDCAVAALSTVCMYYKKEVTLTGLRDICGTDIRGTNIEGLCKGAEKLGFTTKPIRVSNAEFLKGEFTMPAICHTLTKSGNPHYVVLTKIGKKHVNILDPAVGERKILHEKFFDEFDNILIVIKPTNEFISSKIGNKSLLSKFMMLLMPQKKLFITTIVAGLLITLLGIASSFFNMFLIDEILPYGLRDQLTTFCLVFLLISLIGIILSSIRQHIVLHLSQKIGIPLMLGYYSHIFNLPMRFFGTRKTGDIITRFRDAGTIVSVASGIILTVIIDIVFAIVSGIVLYIINPSLFGIILVFTIVDIALIYIFKGPYKKINRDHMEAAARLNSTTIESLKGIGTIKANAAEDSTMENIENKFIESLRIAYRENVLTNYQGSISGVISSVSGLIMMWVGAMFVMDGNITLGTLMAFYSLSGFFMGPMGRLVSLQLSIQEADIALKRLSELFDVEEEREKYKGKTIPESLSGNIVIDDITFRYGLRKPVLSNISLSIKHGERVAIVGESGCGKTTLCNLILGLWTAEEGTITVNDYDLRELDIFEYRRKVAYVQQNVELFSGTIVENMHVVNPSATNDDIRKACNMAGCTDFINKLTSRYDTYLEEAGTNLSGGEKQRLALARAFIKKPEILILDEATSNLDFASEAIVYDSLFNNSLNCTMIIIAHRLSTIRKCDRIFVFDKGTVAESGTHDELLTKKGQYYKLWTSQIGADVNDESLRDTKRTTESTSIDEISYT